MVIQYTYEQDNNEIKKTTIPMHSASSTAANEPTHSEPTQNAKTLDSAVILSYVIALAPRSNPQIYYNQYKYFQESCIAVDMYTCIGKDQNYSGAIKV